jgi:hypothetical protein
LALLSIIYEPHKGSCQGNDDEALQDTIVNEIIIYLIVSSGHGVGFGENIIIVVVFIILMLLLKEVVDPFFQ